MDNKNKNRSPLDEVKHLTENARSASAQKNVIHRARPQNADAAPRINTAPPSKQGSAAQNGARQPISSPRRTAPASAKTSQPTQTIKAAVASPRSQASRPPQSRSVQPRGNTQDFNKVKTPAQRRSAPAAHSKKDVKSNDKGNGRTVVTGTVKAIIYIVSVLVVSGCLALFTIFVGNDVFALVKDSNDVVVTIPEGADLGDIAQILGENNVVKYPSMFKMYINLRHKGADEYLSGTFTVSPSMPYDMLISTFIKSKGARTEITLTFTEGMTCDDVIDLFVENGIGTRDRFVEVINNYDFDYWFVKELDANPNRDRKYRLEGYLFPDTYNFYSDSSEEAAISRLLDNFNAKFDDNYRLGAQQLNMTCDEVVTLASIIQKEAKFVADYPIVSSVFHNRLNNKSVTDGKLESNATVQYTMPKEEVKLELSVEDIEKYDNGYNTYKYPGLPAGAICNPSINAINFALYPQDTDYYYFISDASGANLYARTWQEHQANRAKVEAEAGS